MKSSLEKALRYIKAKFGKSIRYAVAVKLGIQLSSYENQRGKINCLTILTADGYPERLEYEHPDDRGKILWKLPSKNKEPKVSKGSYVGKITGGHLVYIAEGEWDFITLVGMGFKNVISFVNGCMYYPRHHINAFKGKKVVILYDFDDAGIAGAVNLAEWLIGTAAEVVIVDWTGSGLVRNDKKLKDVSDYFNKLGRSARDLQKIIEKSPAYKMSSDPYDSRSRSCKAETREERCVYIVSFFMCHGKFIMCTSGSDIDYYWFSGLNKKLYRIDRDENDIKRFLDHQFRVNASSLFFNHIIERLKTEANNAGIESNVYKVAYYDKCKHILYLHDNRNSIFMLDGKSIKRVDNGTNGVIFVENKYQQISYKPHKKGGMFLKQNLFDRVNFQPDGTPFSLNVEEQMVLFKVWFYFMFFESLARTKPILVLKGEKGSGKTMVLKLILALLFGESKGVGGLTNKDIRDLIAVLKHDYLVFLDNVDSKLNGDTLDMFAKCATGAVITIRRLFSTDDVRTIVPRCFIAMTTRTNPLGRDDVSERSLLLQMRHIKDGTRKTEMEMISSLSTAREEVWYDLLNDLNRIVTKIKNAPPTPPKGKIISRMAEFDAFGRKVVGENGIEKFESALRKLKHKQSENALEYDYFANYLRDIGDRHNGVFCFCVDRDRLYFEFLNSTKDSLDSQIKYFPTRRGFVQYLKNRMTDYKRTLDLFELSNDRKPLIAVCYNDTEGARTKDQMKTKSAVLRSFRAGKAYDPKGIIIESTEPPEKDAAMSKGGKYDF